MPIFFFSSNDLPSSKENIAYQPSIAKLEMGSNKGFRGLWINESNQRKMITKCEISYKKNRFVVQMWGECHPQDCDWGENASGWVEKGANRFELLWDKAAFAESFITYELINGKLKMTHARRFKDGSGRPDNTITEYFTKK